MKHAVFEKTYEFGFSKPERYVYKSPKGITDAVVKIISSKKYEQPWMREFRLKSYAVFKKKKLPTWGPALSDIDFSDIHYYIKPTQKRAATWKELPKEIRETYEKIGMPKAEKDFLSGVSAQYESEVVYKSLKDTLQKKGVVFLSMDEGLAKYPDLVKKYFGKIVPPGDNVFAALNSSVWSGGTFLYVPKGVHVELPLQAYFRMNAERIGQFERTLIIASEGSFVHYVEGCTAPVYSTNALHAAVVEIFVEKGARVRYSTVQNWSKNVYNLVTKRAYVEEEGIMEWVDGNLGSKVTMKYPACILAGRKSHGEVLSIAYAGSGQILDAGAKMIHLAPETTSQIVSKSIAKNGGQTSYRGLVRIAHGGAHARSHVVCDALLVDDISRSDTYPTIRTAQKSAIAEHEASVSKISDETLFYLTSKGIDRKRATTLVVNGFIEPIVKELPLEFAVELNRLIALEMEGSIG